MAKHPTTHPPATRTDTRPADRERTRVDHTDDDADKDKDQQDDPAAGPQSTDGDLAGQKGDFGGALAANEKDVQTEGQVKAGLATTGERPGRGEPQEFIETGPGRVQSTRPVNDPAPK